MGETGSSFGNSLGSNEQLNDRGLRAIEKDERGRGREADFDGDERESLRGDENQEGMGPPSFGNGRWRIPISRGIKPSKSHEPETSVAGKKTTGEDRLRKRIRISGRNKALKVVKLRSVVGAKQTRQVEKVALGPTRRKRRNAQGGFRRKLATPSRRVFSAAGAGER
jgi:hypothetical protein